MENQAFNKVTNTYWIDLHGCATSEAIMIVEDAIKECYKYGVKGLDIIYGTPDRYSGSIREAVDILIDTNHYIKGSSEEWAGITITIIDNQSPEPQDENMYFESFSGAYRKDYKCKDTSNFYPLRKEYSSQNIATEIGCAVEYVREVAKRSLDDKKGQIVTEFNSVTKRNETTWRIYQSGLDLIKDHWNYDTNLIGQELRNLQATDEEIEEILKTIRTPLKNATSAKTRASTALSRLRGSMKSSKNEPSVIRSTIIA